MPQPLPEAHASQQRRRSMTSVVDGFARDAHRHLDVLERVELRQQMMKLKDKPDVAVPELDECGVVHRRQFALLDADRSAADAIETAKCMQQGALANPRSAHDRHHLAAFDRQIEVAQHMDLLRTDPVELVETINGDEGHEIPKRCGIYSKRNACTGSRREA